MKSRAALFAPAAGFLACERPIFRVANRSLPFCVMQCRLNERVYLCTLALEAHCRLRPDAVSRSKRAGSGSQMADSFDHLVGARKQRGRYVETEYLSGFQVDDQ